MILDDNNRSIASYNYSQVSQTAFSENPEKICYKVIFSLMHNIHQVVYHVNGNYRHYCMQ